MSDGLDFREAVRREYEKNLIKNIRTMGTAKVGRVVDAEVMTQAVVKQFNNDRWSRAGAFEGEQGAEFQKARNQYSQGYHALEVMDRDIEQIYFDKFGEGFNGESYPTPPYASYKCACGRVTMQMNAKFMPERCPTCGRLTPLGRLNEEYPEWYKR